MSAYPIEELARALFDEAGDALFLFDPDTDELLDVNSTAERLSEFPRAELLRHPATYLFRFGGKGGMGRLRQASLESGVFHAQDGFFLRNRRDGVWVPVNVTVTRLHVKPKTLALITARDVREQREAHERLSQAEAELRRVLASVSDCLWSAEIDAEGRWTYRFFSPVVERLTGRPPEFFLAGIESWQAAVHPEDRPHWAQALAQLRTGRSSQDEYRVVWPDGTIRWVRENVQASRGEAGGTVRLDGVLTDVTERKQAEEETKKLNAFLDSIVEHVPIMLFVKDAASLRFELFNRAGEKLLGYHRADLIGKNDYDFFPQDEADFFIAKDREVLNGKSLVNIPEEAIQTREGVRTLHTTKIPILDEQGTPKYLLGISEDITERKALEESRRKYAEQLEATNRALGESERRYRQLTEASLDAIIVADQQGSMTLFNPAAERCFGYQAAEVLGQPLTLLMPAEHQAAHDAGLRRYVQTRLAQIVGRSIELRGRRKDGTEFDLELSLSALDLGGELQFLGAIRDLSERNRMRSVLVQNEKLASIGLLSAGVAHEINNPLAFVANNLVVLERDNKALMALVNLYDAARDRLAQVDPQTAEAARALADQIDLPYVRDNLDRVLTRTREGVQRVTRIVQSLRGLARTSKPQLEDASFPDIVDMSLDMVRGRLQRRGIEVELDYGRTPKLRCVTTQLGQVLLNLLVNALQAIESANRPEGGRIRVATRCEGEELWVEVSDNGTGIDPQHVPHLFDPFFTTKPVGEGTGLGLSISHNIITAHGGRIDVSSVPGEGTTFHIFLPLDPERRRTQSSRAASS